MYVLANNDRQINWASGNFGTAVVLRSVCIICRERIAVNLSPERI